MPSVQQGYSTRARASVPKWLQEARQAGLSRDEFVDELLHQLRIDSPGHRSAPKVLSTRA